MGSQQSSATKVVTAAVKTPAVKMATSDFLDGFVKPGFEGVRETFRNNLSSGLETGGSFSAYYKGELAVNLWGGYADKKAHRHWKKDTISCLFSTTKSPSSVVIAHMVDRDLLNYNEKVAKYWPNFAQNGKKDITLEQLMSHQAGLCALDEPFRFSLIRDDPEKLCELLEKQKPLWVPGEGHGYHAITFALYLDQIVRKVDPQRRNLSQYFKDEIAEPFGIDLQIGLPKKDHHRATRLVTYRKPGKDPQASMEVLLENFKGDPEVFNKMPGNVVEWIDARIMNDPDIMELPIGSTHGFGTSEAVAKFHGIIANGGVHQGKRLLSEELISQLQKPLVKGYEKAYGLDVIFGLGTIMITAIEGSDKPNYIFGHPGYGGQNGAADTKRKVGFAYVSNFMNPDAGAELEDRWVTLYDSLYECIDKMENRTLPRKTYHLSTEFLRQHSKL